jgi:ADP-L-glycero-D-manno-heptose 6-epimerase
MLIVTGGAGFIGSNLVHELNAHGIADILVVDNFANANKFRNLHGARYVDCMDKREFRRAIGEDALGAGKIEAILHQGACSNTLEDDGAYMMDNNFQYTKEVLAFAIRQGAPLVYASTAAVYGLSGPGHFTPTIENERPLNIYGFSKLAFDHYFRHQLALDRIPITVVGLRYFNVYGPREQHKGRMASVIHHFTRQIKETGKVRLFAGSGGFGPGEQRRDFVYVRNLARMNMFFAQIGPYAPKNGEAPKPYRGVVNAGTGVSRSFNDVAKALMAVHGEHPIEYIPFPTDLEGRYQHFTEADLTGLRALGCDLRMTALEEGVAETCAALKAIGD